MSFPSGRLGSIIINNDPGIAKDAQAAGVTHIMVDLENIGKKERQASRTTFISTHVKEDIPVIRKVVDKAKLVVRINGWHEDSPEELNYAVGEGADIIMLPMITSIDQVESFLEHLDDRAKPLPLVETGYSMAHISTIAAEPKIDDIYIGLNDLHLSLGLDFLFEPLALGIIDWMASEIRGAGKRFGFGGMATLRSGELPAERVLAEHVRLGSNCVILSSRFCHDIKITQEAGRAERLKTAVDEIQREYKQYGNRTSSQQHADFKDTAMRIRALATKMRSRSSF